MLRSLVGSEMCIRDSIYTPNACFIFPTLRTFKTGVCTFFLQTFTPVTITSDILPRTQFPLNILSPVILPRVALCNRYMSIITVIISVNNSYSRKKSRVKHIVGRPNHGAHRSSRNWKPGRTVYRYASVGKRFFDLDL